MVWSPELAGGAEERVVTVDEERLALWALGGDGRAVKVSGWSKGGEGRMEGADSLGAPCNIVRL